MADIITCLYIDVDGVMLTELNGRRALAPHAEEFLRAALGRFDRCYWLSTYSQNGDAERVVQILERYGPPRFRDLLRRVEAAPWEFHKTEGIDLETDFYWVDDAPDSDDVARLARAGKLDRLIQINTRLRPQDLLRAMERLGLL